MTSGAGFYVSTASALHRRDPVAKLAVAGAVCVWTVALRGHAPWGILAGIALAAAAGRVAKPFLRGLSIFGIPLVLAVALIVAVAPAEQEVMARLSVVTLTPHKLVRMSNLTARLLVLVGTFQLFALTTHPEDLFASAVSRGMPRGLAFGVVAALQFLPNMKARLRAVRDAQVARGLNVSGGPLSRARALGPLVRPVLISVLDEAAERELALVLRGFELEGPTTSVRQAEMGDVDRYAVILSVVATAGGLLWLIMI